MWWTNGYAWKERTQAMKTTLQFMCSKEEGCQEIVLSVRKEEKKTPLDKELILCTKNKKTTISFLERPYDPYMNPFLPCPAENVQGTQNILVPRAIANAFRALSQCNFNDDFNCDTLELDDIFDVLLLVRKLNVTVFQSQFMTNLYSRLNHKTSMKIFEYATANKFISLKEAALDIIHSNPESCIRTKDFLRLSNPNLCTILRDDYFAVDELLIFHHVLLWGKRFCQRLGFPGDHKNLYEITRQSLRLVRFPLIGSISLMRHVEPLNLITRETLAHLYSYSELRESDFHLEEHAPLIQYIKSTYNTKKREMKSRPVPVQPLQPEVVDLTNDVESDADTRNANNESAGPSTALKVESKISKLHSKPLHFEIVPGKFKQSLRSSQTDPLVVPELVDYIYKFLGFSDLKNCRLVSKRWAAFGNHPLISKSLFSYNTRNWGIGQTNRQLLSHFVTQDIRFTSFKFEYDLFDRPISEICFQPNMNTMSRLEIVRSCTYMMPSRQPNSNVQLPLMIGDNLKELIISTRHDNPEMKSILHNRLEVKLDQNLARVPSVVLNSCTLVRVSKNVVQLASKELKLIDFMQKEENEIVLRGNIDKLIDFSNLQTLHICCCSELYARRFTIKISSCLRVKDLRLTNMRVCMDDKISPSSLTLLGNHYFITDNDDDDDNALVLNEYLNSTFFDKLVLGKLVDLYLGSFEYIKELRLWGKLLERGNNRFQTKVDRMEIRWPHGALEDDFDSDAYFRLIPKNLEFLHIVAEDGHGDIPFAMDHHVSLPNLKQLVLQRNGSAIAHFQHMNLLADVALSFEHHTNLLNVDSLPRGIKRLAFCNFPELRGSSLFQLDVLVIYMHNLDNINNRSAQLPRLFAKFQSKLIVFHNYCFKQPQKTHVFYAEEVDRILQVKSELGIQNIAFGPINWQQDSFRNSELARFQGIDKNNGAEYYLLEGQRGKAIKEDDFQKLVPFNKTTHIYD